MSFHAFTFRVALGLAAFSVVTSAALPEAAAQAKKPPAKDVKAAREAYEAGSAAYAKGNYTEALTNFQKANGIIPSPVASYWIAMSLDQLGRKEEAVFAFEELLRDPNVEKIGEEKLKTAKERLTALKTPPEPEPEPTPPPEEKPAEEAPPPPEEPPPPPPEEQAPVPPPSEEKKWNDSNLFEVGLFTGPLFFSSSHNLQEQSVPHGEYSGMTWLVGVRAGYTPVKFLAIEGEYAHGFGSVDEPPATGDDDDSASFNTVRGHLVGQIPVAKGRVVPFALLGAGFIEASSDVLGSDSDFLLDAGIGAKLAVGKFFTPRLDLRLDLTQKEGGGFGDGIAVSPEVLLGLGVTLGR